MKTLPYYIPLASRPTAMICPTHLLLVREEELIRVDAIGDSTAKYWEPVKYDRRLVGVLEQQLLQDVEKNR